MLMGLLNLKVKKVLSKKYSGKDLINIKKKLTIAHF